MVPADDGGHPSCAWVTVYPVEDDASCTLGTPVPQCVSVRYQGEGCVVFAVCGYGSGKKPSIYHRDVNGVTELFAAGLCETQPVGWQECDWPSSTATGGAGSTGPDPNIGGDPPVCECLCGV